MRETNSLRFNIRPEARERTLLRGAAKPISITARDRVISREMVRDQRERDRDKGRVRGGSRRKKEISFRENVGSHKEDV